MIENFADFIAVDLVAGQSYSFAMVGIGATPLQDGRLRLYASDGTVLLGEDDNSLPNGHALLRFTAVETERAYLQASAVGIPQGYPDYVLHKKVTEMMTAAGIL